MIRHEVLIVGGGLAGLRAAVGLAEHWDVAVVSQVHPVRSHSGAAQGGINAALSNAPAARDDTPERHAFDTVEGSDYLADQAAVLRMCQLAPAVMDEFDRWGAPFSRFPDGRIAQRPFGAAGFPRTCFAADRTGHVLLQTLYEQAVRRGVRVYEEHIVTRLAVADGRYHGLIAYNLPAGRFERLASRFCVLATGGYGCVYRYSTNALISTGSGIGLALRAGLPVKDLEFVQFHPTSLYGTNILITEGARGEGGHLVNRLGERFMQRYAPQKMELAPRDIASRSIQTEIDEGRGFAGGYVHLDLRHLGRETILQRFPGIRQICLEFANLDPIDEPLPILPAQHYSMGGVDTDVTGATAVAGLYAAGECACVSVHGANRLGGNSLLETVVFGRLAAEAIDGQRGAPAGPPAEAVIEEAYQAQTQHVQMLLSRRDGPSAEQLRDRLRSVCTQHVGIFRQESGLAEAVRQIRALQAAYREVGCRTKLGPFNYELLRVLELESMLAVAEVIACGALARRESRGSHFRTDYPRRDDAGWLKHTVARRVDDELVLTYNPVDTSLYVPRARTY